MAIARDRKTQILTELDSPQGEAIALALAYRKYGQTLRYRQRILAEQYRPGSKVATKEEEAQLAQNKGIVTKAATYTVDTIVKGMADLQLEFGSIITGRSHRLTVEFEKLTEVKQSIETETPHRSELQQVRIVADALHIITQEHQQSLKAIEQQLTEWNYG